MTFQNIRPMSMPISMIATTVSTSALSTSCTISHTVRVTKFTTVFTTQVTTFSKKVSIQHAHLLQQRHHFLHFFFLHFFSRRSTHSSTGSHTVSSMRSTISLHTSAIRTPKRRKGQFEAEHCDAGVGRRDFRSGRSRVPVNDGSQVGLQRCENSTTGVSAILSPVACRPHPGRYGGPPRSSNNGTRLSIL